MNKIFKGDIVDLSKKSLIISDRLAYFRRNNERFNYTIKFTIGKVSKLRICTNRKK